MLTDREKLRVGKLIARIPATRKPLRMEEGGLCQLRSKHATDLRVNRHYAIGGPNYNELDRSLHSRRSETTVPYYCRFDIFEYGQPADIEDCARRLSRLSIQLKVSELRHCRRQDLSPAEARYLGQCFMVCGKVNQVFGYDTYEPSCSEAQCAIGKDGTGMYPCRMKPAPVVMEEGQTIEFVYHVEEQSGRLISVFDYGKLRTYSFTPQEFIAKGGFGPTQLNAII